MAFSITGVVVNSGGNTLTVSTDLGTGTTTGGATGFTVKENGNTKSISFYTHGANGSITLTLSGAYIAAGSTVTLDLTASSIYDNANSLNYLNSVTAYACTNNSTAATPVFTSGSVDSAGTTLTTNWNVGLQNGTGFTVKVNGSDFSANVASAYNSGTTRIWTFSVPILAGQTVTLDYAAGNVSAVTTAIPLANFTGQAITNNSTQTLPTVVSQVLASDGVTLTVTFSASVSNSTGFAVTVNGATRTFTIAGSGTTRTITLNSAAYQNETVRLSYTPGNISNANGNMASFSNYVVTNNSTQPFITAASLASGGYVVTLTLAVGCTNSEGFVLKVNGVSKTFAVAGSTTTRTLTAYAVIYSTDVVTVDYVPGNITKTSDAVAITAISGRAVTNNSTQIYNTTPPPGGGVDGAAPGTSTNDGITSGVSLGGGLPQSPSALASRFPSALQGNAARLNIGIEIVKWPMGSQYPTARRHVYDHDWFDLRFTYQRRGGYGSFSFVAMPDLANEINEDDVLLVYAGPTVIFTGRIESVLLDENSDARQYSCSGTESILSLRTLPVNIGPFDSPVSIYWLLTKLVAQLQKDYPYMAVTTIAYGDIADTTLSVNCAGKTYFEAFDELAGHCTTPICWGIRHITSSRQYEFYFLKLNSTSTYRNISKYDAKGYAEEFDTTQLFTEIQVKGSIDPKYPSLYTNYSLEECKMNSDNVTFNEIPIPDAGFEDNAWGWTDTTGWTLSSGASIKSTGDDSGTVEARSGVKCLEIDAIGEKATITIDRFNPVDGQYYRFGFWYRPEVSASTGSPPVIRCNVIWKDSGGSTLVTDSFYTDPQTTKNWFYKSADLVAPSTAAKFTIELIGSSGTFSTSNGGIHLDDVKVFIKDMPYPTNWQIDSKGTGSVTSYDFDEDTAHHGFTFARIRALASSTSNCVRIYNIQSAPIVGGQQVKTSVRIRKVGAETWPNLEFVAEFYKPDTDPNDPPVLISTFTSSISISAPADWTYTSTQFEAPNETTFAICYYRIISDGSIDFDLFCLRDAKETGTDEYGDKVEIVRDASTLVASEPYTSSIANYGRRRKILEAAVDTIADAEKAAKVWLLANIRFNKSPRITEEIDCYEALPDITKTFRVIEYNKVFPVESIDCSIGDEYNKVSSLQYRTPDIADIINNIQEKGPKVF